MAASSRRRRCGAAVKTSPRGVSGREPEDLRLRERLELRSQARLDARAVGPVHAELLVFERADEVARELFGRQAVRALRQDARRLDGVHQLLRFHAELDVGDHRAALEEREAELLEALLHVG